MSLLLKSPELKRNGPDPLSGPMAPGANQEEPPPPLSMAEIQGCYQPKWSLHLPPLCFGMKITALGAEFEAKINIIPSSLSSLLFHSNNHMPLDNGIKRSNH